MTITSSQPLLIFESLNFAKETFIQTIGKYKCKITAYPKGIKFDAIDIVNWKGHFWGIVPSKISNKYDYLAVITDSRKEISE